MKKLLMVIALAVAMTAGGCGRRPPIAHSDYSRFKTVETYRDGWEVVDTDTGYSYFVFSGGNGIVPIFDEYGEPYKANGWRDIGV